MDPNANIAEQREIAQRIVARPRTIVTHSDDPAERYDVVRSATRLAELVLALDEWRRGGGFDPYTEPTPGDSPAIFLAGNLSDGFRAFGPYPDIDEAFAAHGDDEGWGLVLGRKTNDQE